MEQNDIKAEPAKLTATIQVVRAATGKVEEYELVLTPQPELQDEPKEAE